jgi:glycosyltransferase involved in cell wall biosynthesis
MTKIKVFLGGFINYANAQNLNCRALAEHLDTTKFEIYTLNLEGGQLPRVKKDYRINIFHCFKPVRISIYIGFLWGIWNCDVAYLPKGELWRFNLFLLKFLRKKSFSTLEGIIDETALNNTITSHGTLQNYIKSRSYFDKQYSITNYMKNYNYEKIALKTEDKILYLGVDSDFFKMNATKKTLDNVLMIGNDLVRKGVYDYLEIAGNFPEITFFLAGSGNGKIDMDLEIKNRNLNNVIYQGLVTSDQLIALLKDTALHILPSRSEGFPKVTLETAAAGVPSIVYADYGAEEWITNGVNGWVVKNVDEMISIFNDLKNNPEKLSSVSQEAIKLAVSFDWKVRVKDWEEVITQLKNE